MPLSLILAVAATYAVGDAILAPRPAPASPGFLDTILASRVVVASVRIAVVAASCFVVVSVVALTRNGRWLTRVGPVEASDVSGVYEENRQLKESLDIADNAIQDLRRQMAE